MSETMKLSGIMALGAIGALLGSTGTAHAQYVYTSQISTTTRLAQDVGGDLVTTVVVVIGIIAGLFVLMVGAGFIFRKTKKYVTGSKF